MDDPRVTALEHAAANVKLAVKYDEQGQYQVALDQYITALTFLMPLLRTETDTQKHQVYLQKCTEYIKRAELLKQHLKNQNSLPPLNLTDFGTLKNVNNQNQISIQQESSLKSLDHPLFRKMSDFKILKQLGEGGFGTCFKVFDTKAHRICVVKKIKYHNTKDVYEISNEIRIIRKLEHPNIVKYFATFLDQGEMCLSMEYCSQGDLYQYIVNREEKNNNIWTPLDEKIFWKWTLQICSAMSYVHSQGILHRDLKPSNIFLTTINPDEQNVPDIDKIPKIGDFGLSYELVKSKSKASSKVGTYLYWPPELYQNELPTMEADIYAIGAILYELLLGTHNPATNLLLSHKKEDHIEQLKKYYAPNVFVFISSLLKTEKKERPPFVTILRAIQDDNMNILSSF